MNAGANPSSGQECGPNDSRDDPSYRTDSHCTYATASSKLVLLVDDDDLFRDLLKKALERRGYRVTSAAGRDEAVREATADPPDMAILDLRMPYADGLTVLRQLLAIHPTTKVLVLTGYGSITTAVTAMQLGAVSYLSKPANTDEILAAFARADRTLDAESLEPTKTPSLDQVEWEHIQRVLAECDGNVSETARQLGLPRRTLQRKLRKRPL